MIIGITGEICAGKSLVSKIILKHKQFYYINVDDVARFIVEPGKKGYNEIIGFFGQEILNADNTINRLKLGEIVFSDYDKLQKLNGITHKYIYSEVNKTINILRNQDPFAFEFNVIVDAALLHEIRLDSIVDQVWYVDADKHVRLKRLMSRNNFSEEQALKRIQSQTIVKHKGKADVIIINNGDEQELEKQVLENLKLGVSL